MSRIIVLSILLGTNLLFLLISTRTESLQPGNNQMTRKYGKHTATTPISSASLVAATTPISSATPTAATTSTPSSTPAAATTPISSASPTAATTTISNAPVFTGPLTGWASVTSFGAKGDGTTDDTAAIQNALNQLGQSGKPSVLYLPAGTYKISSTLNLTGAINVKIVGADPSTTKLLWSGASGGTMLNLQNTAYSNLERLTFDGNNTAGKDLWIQWDGKSTYFPTTFGILDDVFKNAQIGIQGGNTGNSTSDTAAEVSIERVQFLNNTTAGVYLNDYNTVDWWVRNSNFQNNLNGIKVDAGVFHAYNSNFISNKNSDIYANNNAFMGLRNNYSSGSPHFYYAGGTTGSLLVSDIENNRIVNTSGTALLIKNPGPSTIVNNIIQNASGNNNPAVSVGGFNPGAVTAIGNTFTVANPISLTSSYGYSSNIQANNTVVSSSTINTAVPVLPSTPALSTAPIINVTTLTGAAIQAAINQANTTYAGQRAIIHLVSGNYSVSSAINIGAGSTFILTGDTAGATSLSSNGFTGSVFNITGPSSATVENLAINGGGKSQGIAISGVDQSGGKILMDQVTSNGYDGSGQALNVTGLNQTVVNVINGQLQGTKGINVAGGNNVTTASVNLMGGSNGPDFEVNNNGNLLVQDNWYENGSTRYPVLNLSGSGKLTIDDSLFAYTGSASKSTPNINLNSFTGNLTLSNDVLAGVSMNIPANNSTARILVNNTQFEASNGVSASISNSSTSSNVSFQGVYLNGSSYSNSGSASPAFISSMLGQITASANINPLVNMSTLVPSGTTDLVLQGIHISAVSSAISISN